MSALQKLSTGISNALRHAGSSFHSLAPDSPSLFNPGGLFNIAVRYNIRNHFPRPSERKRIRTHGWVKRMSTPGGQRVLMHRILKGKHVYSH